MEQPGTFLAPLIAIVLPLAIVTKASSFFYKRWGVFRASTIWVGLGVIGWVAILCLVGQPDTSQALMAFKDLSFPILAVAVSGSLLSGIGGTFLKRSPWLGAFLGGLLGVSTVCFWILHQAMQQSVGN